MSQVSCQMLNPEKVVCFEIYLTHLRKINKHLTTNYQDYILTIIVIKGSIMNKYLLLLVIAVTPQASFAYLDPGTGSMILQAVAGIMFASIFFIKSYYSKIKNRILKIKNKK